MSKRKKDKEKRKGRSTASAAKRRAETHKTGFENTSFTLPDDKKVFKIKSDKALRLDIIPFIAGDGNPYADKGELHYERTFFTHRGIGADNTSYVCLRKTNNEPCPICDHRAALMKDPDADEDLIKDLAPKERQLFNVIDIKDKDKGVQLWEISYHLFGKRLDSEIKNADEDDGYENFAELEAGFTLKCGIEEKSFNGQKFYEVSTINFKARSEDYDEDILEEATCLDDILIIKDYDELKEIFLQTKDDDDDDDKKSSKKKKTSKKSKKEEEPEEEEPEEESEEESEEGWNVDDRVIVTMDTVDYAGIIIEIDEDDITIEFDDGDIQTVDISELKPEEEEPEDEEPEDDEPEEKSSKKEKKNKKDKKSKKNKCPGDGQFGVDTDDLPECEDCPIWDECDDA